MNAILAMAKQQFSDIIGEPLVIFVLCALFVFSVLNGAASVKLLSGIDANVFDSNDHFLSVAMSNTVYHTSLLLSALSMFIGVLTIAEERSKGSLYVLLIKPMYRRDVIAGKFLGLSVFLFISVVVVVFLCVSSIMFFYRGPVSLEEMVIRVSSYTVVLFLSCILTLGLSYAISILFKNFLEALMVAGILLFVNWYLTLPQSLLSIKFLIPTSLYFMILDGVKQQYLLNTSIPYSAWFNASLPYIIFMIVYIFAIFLFSCYVFNSQED
jgi:ABC-type transport system involved in multi-copper enzyme maturation permease subunit